MKPFIARLTAILFVGAGVPVLVASSAPADTGAGSTQSNPIILTSLSALPPGAVVVSSTLDQCATITTYSVTTPAVVETTRSEYRWPLDVRTYTPAVKEVKEYTYKKPKKEYRFKYQKQVAGKVLKDDHGSWEYDSTFDYEWWVRPTWNTDGSFKWGDWNETADVIESGDHSETSNTWTSDGVTYRKQSTSYRYFKTDTSESRVVPDAYEYLDWTTEILGEPWIKTGERIKVAAQPAKFSAWVFDSWTAWSASSAAPADPDGQSGEDNPLNLRRVGSPMETRSVGNGDAVPAKVTYYRYSDGKVCPPEVLGEQAGRATGKLHTTCQRTVRVTMKNASAETVAYKIKVGKKTTMKRVKADSTRVWTTTGQYRDIAKLMLGSKVLDKARVPKPCRRPEVLPATGLRQK